MCAVDLVSANLSKVLDLLISASIKWFVLGLQLGVSESHLKVIEQDHRIDGIEVCLRKMISLWLSMINPRPSWEGLVAALEKPSVGMFVLAKGIREEYGVTEQAEMDRDSATAGSITASSDGTGGLG